MLAKKTGSLFGKPTELDDAWIENHKGHSLCWMNHTIFAKAEKNGTKFRECICYTCRKVARQLLGQVNEMQAPATAEKKTKKEGWEQKEEDGSYLLRRALRLNKLRPEH